MIQNESNKPIAYWLDYLRLFIKKVPITGYKITTEIASLDTEFLMEYFGWQPDAGILCRFNKGILCEIEWEENDGTLEGPKETGIKPLYFDTREEAEDFILPLYRQFSTKWQETTLLKYKHLLG